MGKKKRAKSKVFTYLVLIVCAAIWILPLVIALTKSFTINGFGNYAYVLSYKKSVILRLYLIVCLSELQRLLLLQPLRHWRHLHFQK